MENPEQLIQEAEQAIADLELATKTLLDGPHAKELTREQLDTLKLKAAVLKLKARGLHMDTCTFRKSLYE